MHKIRIERLDSANGIWEAAIAPKSLRCVHNAEFGQPEIERKKSLLIFLLNMISERVPPVLPGAGNDAGANRIEIDRPG
ncbi:MAG: hypothetical protein V2B19_14275 [Pseudomonadota bacterium]